MWGRKSKTKKSGRQYALDVKARSKPLQALRLRMAVSALAISSGIVLVLFVAWKGGEWLVDRYVFTNPAFAIEQLEIETDGIIPLEQVRTWANVSKGQNLLALDLTRIKRDLELVPLIESASVERYLPRRLRLRVQEREPIARVIYFQPSLIDGSIERSAYYLDKEGMVIPPYARALNVSAFDRATHLLPNLIGVRSEELRPGHKVTREPLLAALRWVSEFAGSPMAGHVDVRSVDLSAGNTLVVSTEQGHEVTFALRDFEGQLARWRKIYDFSSRQPRLLASLDLAVTNYVPVAWNDSTNAAPPSVRRPPAQPSPYRKKHV